jgi:serine/threonine protein kinase
MSKQNAIDAINQLGKFSSIEETGSGGCSYTFTAKHKLLNEYRFLKVVDCPDNCDSIILKEPQYLLNAVNANPPSNNIVKLFDVDISGEGSNRFAILQLELIKSPDLETYLHSTDYNIGQQDAVRIIQGILDGISHLHCQSLLHRDIKLANVLIDNGVPRIADFGSVIKVEEGCQYVGASRGTSLYKPHESWVNDHYLHSSDVYQAGLIFYQLINGAFPSNGKAFLTKRAIKELNAAGKTYESLDGFESCSVENSCIAELVSKNRLLDIISPRPYYHDSIRRIINKMTTCDLSNRYNNANDTIRKLASISVPNWKPIVANVDMFEALNWRNYDWRLSAEKRRAGMIYVIKKRKPGGAYRSWDSFTSIGDAFKKVDGYSR